MVVNEYEVGNAEIRVYRPRLTDVDRQMRERHIRAVLQTVGRSLAEKRRGTNGNSNTSRDFGEKRVLD